MERRRRRAVVLIVGIGRCPGRVVYRTGQFGKVVVRVVLILIARNRVGITRFAARYGEALFRACHAATGVVVLEEDCAIGLVVAKLIEIAFAVKVLEIKNCLRAP